ncbi:MAG: hypothetical protein U0X40_09690 [Ferruginibacter sp.]
MKRLAFCAWMLLIIFSATRTNAQTPGTSKPKQFDAYPNVITCTEAELARIFSAPAGQDINVVFSTAFNFPGNINFSASKYDNLQTVMVKSAYFHNSVLNITRRINRDNTVTYSGHIFNKDYFDGYELKKNAAGGYTLTKIQTDRFLQVCAN